MSSLIPSGGASGTGSVTLLAPNTNSTQIQTLPDATGTVMVSGNMPAFSATGDVTQSIPNNTYTKILFTVEQFDTNNNFSSSTFTPTVAGYYQLNAWVNTQTSSGTSESLLKIYKNGSQFAYGTDTKSDNYGKGMSLLVYANGSTDYFEVYFYQGSGGAVLGNSVSYFQGFMVRGA